MQPMDTLSDLLQHLQGHYRIYDMGCRLSKLSTADFKAFEEGSQTMSKEANTQLAIRQEKFIRDLRNALIRIENKTYGICRVTGKLIRKERLVLVPHATLSIEAKNMQK